MAKKTAKKPAISNTHKLGIGVGLTAAAVAAAGAYFLYGSKDAVKNRKVVKSWAIKAKGEVLEALEKAEQMTEDEFNKLVGTVASTYGQVQKLSQTELADFKKEMSANWKSLAKFGAKKPAKKTAKTAGSKTAKKATTKAVAKKAPAKKK